MLGGKVDESLRIQHELFIVALMGHPAVASRYQAPAGLDSPQPGLTVPPGSPTTA